MADTKITALAAITTIDTANDVLPIVDVDDHSMAASGTTKRVTTNQLLGAGGTATLASATISGNLTVDTNTFFVDSTNNRIGVGTTTPLNAAQIQGAGQATVTPTVTGDGSALSLIDSAGLANSGGMVAFGASVANGNIGQVSIKSLLTNGSANGTSDIAIFTRAATSDSTLSERFRIAQGGVCTWSNVGGVAGTAMTLNSTGLGIGVTPSAWVANKALSIGSAGSSLWANSSGIAVGLTQNTYFNGTNFIYQATAAAAYYNMLSGAHQWFTAPSGTAGNAITFTQAMTLDASGRLLVGTANASVTSETGCRLLLNNGAVGHFTLAVTTNQSTAATSCYDFYSTSAAAYRFYVTSAGVINATNTTISAISDARLKENVQDIDVGLGAILALKPRKFDWKAGKGKDIKGDRGFIAQEFEQVFPQLVDEWKDAAPEGEAPYKSVRQDLIPVLVKAIQELTARVQTLEAK